jgi:hypothetical protein
MRINKVTYLLIIMLFACSAGMAQGMVLNFTPIVSSTSAFTAVGGTPIIMNGSGKCVTASSGLSVLNVAHNGNGEFQASCKEVAPVATQLTVSISLNIYPNPTSGPATLKCEGQFDANLSGQVRVTSMAGKVMMSQMVPMKDIKAGFVINAGSYAAGTYVVTLDFMSQRYPIKLIKL